VSPYALNASKQLAKDFLRHAVEFRDAALRLHDHKPFLFHPTFYCVLHSIELALKAHLAQTGFSKRTLSSKALGHNLGALLTAASRERVLDKSRLDALDRKAIAWGAKDYSKKCFEYPEFMVSTHPIRKWLLIARKLVGSAQDVVTSRPSRS
jgi:hypothetical protein